MCGIFGLYNADNSGFNNKEIQNGLKNLFLLSETRGKEASGFCLINEDKVEIYKRAIRAKSFISGSIYKKMVSEINSEKHFLAMGHARMVTNGDSWKYQNNQPVVKKDLVCIHNGIIVNDLDLWKTVGKEKRQSDVDTEVFLELLYYNNYKNDFYNAFIKSIDMVEGSITIAMVDKTRDFLLLYTNVGSLYYVIDNNTNSFLFASEKYILEQTITDSKLLNRFSLDEIKQIPAKCGYIINMYNGEMNNISHQPAENNEYLYMEHKRDCYEKGADLDRVPLIKPYNYVSEERTQHLKKEFFSGNRRIKDLNRCVKCLLPETFPGISFDNDGVCSICRDYKIKKIQSKEALISQIKANKKDSDRYDCIIPISGGRDSCYMLHYLVKEMGVKPVAYTYDWGMVTDLARRNIQRMCSSLGVEHILISADIKKKRHNIKLNVQAWLKKPSLATVPLFMAGDKQFFYYAQLLKKQMHISTIIFGMNDLEETQFKVRFANVKSGKKGGQFYDLSKSNKLKLAMQYGKEFIKNPRFINRSLVDTFGGFVSYYMLPKDYLQFFDYIEWDENEIESVLLKEYNWETDPHTDQTWRIGDGTAAFYNYIYYKMAGFTEFDTFRSNQIRQGMLTREEAKEKLGSTNPSIEEDFEWYCDTIGIDPIYALETINSQRTLY